MEVDYIAEPQFDDSEDEREYKEQQKDKAECRWALDKSMKSGVCFYLQGELSKTMARIVYEESRQESGKCSATFKDSMKNNEEKTDEVMTLYKIADEVYFLVAEKTMKGPYVN